MEEESFVYVARVVVAEEVDALATVATGMAVGEGQGCICADCPYWTPLR